MSERGPRTEASMFLEVDRLERDNNDEDKMAHYDDDKDDDDLMSAPSGSRVYDRTTVLIEQDPIRLDEEGEEDHGHCVGDDDGGTFLVDGDLDEEEEEEEGSMTFMGDQDGMLQGYVHHTISPDQIQFIINPGSMAMPRNIEGATLTLHSECPETKQREKLKKCQMFQCTEQNCYKSWITKDPMPCPLNQPYCELKKMTTGSTTIWMGGCSANCTRNTWCTTTTDTCHQECCNTSMTSCLKLDGTLNVPSSATRGPHFPLALVTAALLVCLLSIGSLV